uniref:Helically-extended SH3 domain-containing protein n=1 Tax=Denticeps clupeoides TaxID=299321 RepID=A0AAY3ZVD9_9TELE
MEQESSINVKSLRAKFQEEAQDKSRPPVPGKPRRLPVAGPRCASLMTSFNTSVGTKTMPVLPKVPVKEQPSAHPSATSGTVGSNHVGTAKPLFKDIHLPLVLPIPFSAEPRHHSPPKGAIPTSTCQKAAFMPLKSEEAEQGSAVGAAKPAHGCFRNREGSKRESRHPCPETPPQADPASPTDHGVLSTMEKAKRKFSPKQLLEYARPKGFYSSSPPTVSPPPSSTDYENLASDRTPLPPHCEGFTHATTYHAPSSLFPASCSFLLFYFASSCRKERGSPEILQRRKEKQRVEKEKKEQKEREKKENEMKKKFKVTGQEEPMYHARVIVAGKVRKHDLPVKSGDTVSIIRTTNCPKGKWLARDTNQKYGYISVMNVELNIKEMMELGKKVSQGASRGANEGDSISVGSRFTDDSEEWTCDDDTLSPTADLM